MESGKSPLDNGPKSLPVTVRSRNGQRRKVVPPSKPPRFVTCRCQHCGSGIEFDARDFQTGETRSVDCPHCHKGTVIGVERPTPKRLADVIGQNRVKARLELATEAAKRRGETLGHVLLIRIHAAGIEFFTRIGWRKRVGFLLHCSWELGLKSFPMSVATSRVRVSARPV
jgi:Holliday junction DNA helicase RuvB P-loop domain